MLNKSQLHMATSSVVQQISGLLVFLSLPNILTVDQYALTVVITTIVSFFGFFDLGLGNSYSREISGYELKTSGDETERYDSTIFWGKLYISSTIGLIFFIGYFFYYQTLLSTSLLWIVSVIMCITQMIVAKFGSLEKFNLTKSLLVIQSMTKLALIPLSYIFGVNGWLVGLLLISLSPMVMNEVRGFLSKQLSIRYIDWNLIRENCRHGFILGLVTIIWGQLLYVARLIAATFYSNDAVAAYGLVTGVYQIIAALIISISIPQSVTIYKLFEVDAKKALQYANESAKYILRYVLVLSIIAIFAMPFLFDVLYPRLKVEFLTLVFSIATLIFIPKVVSSGAFLVAYRKYFEYLAILVFAFITSWIVEFYIRDMYSVSSASIAQFVSVFLYAVVIHIYTSQLIPEDKREK